MEYYSLKILQNQLCLFFTFTQLLLVDSVQLSPVLATHSLPTMSLVSASVSQSSIDQKHLKRKIHLYYMCERHVSKGLSIQRKA